MVAAQLTLLQHDVKTISRVSLPKEQVLSGQIQLDGAGGKFRGDLGGQGA